MQRGENYDVSVYDTGRRNRNSSFPVDWKRWTEREGYSDEEIAMFEELLRNNAHLLYKYAENGGIQIA